MDKIIIVALFYFVGLYWALILIITVNDNIKMENKYSRLIKNRYCALSWLLLIIALITLLFKYGRTKFRTNR